MKEMKVNSWPGGVEVFDETPPAPTPATADWIDRAVECASRAEIARAVRNGHRGPDNGNTQSMRVYDDYD